MKKTLSCKLMLILLARFVLKEAAPPAVAVFLSDAT